MKTEPSVEVHLADAKDVSKRWCVLVIAVPKEGTEVFQKIVEALPDALEGIEVRTGLWMPSGSLVHFLKPGVQLDPSYG